MAGYARGACLPASTDDTVPPFPPGSLPIMLLDQSMRYRPAEEAPAATVDREVAATGGVTSMLSLDEGK